MISMAFPTESPVTAGKPDASQQLSAFLVLTSRRVTESFSWSPVATIFALVLSYITWRLYGRWYRGSFSRIQAHVPVIRPIALFWTYTQHHQVDRRRRDRSAVCSTKARNLQHRKTAWLKDISRTNGDRRVFSDYRADYYRSAKRRRVHDRLAVA
jgi:hypothetical protein